MCASTCLKEECIEVYSCTYQIEDIKDWTDYFVLFLTPLFWCWRCVFFFCVILILWTVVGSCFVLQGSMGVNVLYYLRCSLVQHLCGSGCHNAVLSVLMNMGSVSLQSLEGLDYACLWEVDTDNCRLHRCVGSILLTTDSFCSIPIQTLVNLAYLPFGILFNWRQIFILIFISF